MVRLRKYTFIIVIVGIFVLFIWFFQSSAVMIHSASELQHLPVNQKVNVFGSVVKEGTFGTENELILNSGIKGLCHCSGLQGKNISLIGRVTKIYNKKYVQVLSYNVHI